MTIFWDSKLLVVGALLLHPTLVHISRLIDCFGFSSHSTQNRPHRVHSFQPIPRFYWHLKQSTQDSKATKCKNIQLYTHCPYTTQHRTALIIFSSVLRPLVHVYGTRCHHIYASMIVSDNLNGCSRLISLVLETAALCDILLGAPCINLLTYLLLTSRQTS